MCSDALIRRIAGLFVMVSLALGTWVHPAWLLFTAFVGFNLFQSSLTGFCPLERILGRVRLFGCTPRGAVVER
jgi:hypothetical protein